MRLIFMSLDSRFKSSLRMPESVWSLLRAFPQRHLIASALVACFLMGLIAFPTDQGGDSRQVIETIELELKSTEVNAPVSPAPIAIAPQPTLRWRAVKV